MCGGFLARKRAAGIYKCSALYPSKLSYQNVSEEEIVTKKIEEYGSYFFTNGVTTPKAWIQTLASNIIWIKNKNGDLFEQQGLNSSWKDSQLMNNLFILNQNGKFLMQDYTKNPFQAHPKTSNCNIQ